MSLCPCGSQQTLEHCCGQYLDNKQVPSTPEQLMRSRYTAYSLAKIPYIKATMKNAALEHFNEADAYEWAKSVVWIKLEVLKHSQESPDLGHVEFAAYFLERDQLKNIHELSEFQLIDNRWFYTSGQHRSSKNKKIGRNTPCPCGSGKKFKNCHES